MHRRRAALLAAAAAAVLLASCAPSAVDPGIAADTSGPLTRDQATALIEDPLADLSTQLSGNVPQAVNFASAMPVEVTMEDGTCIFTSTVYRSEGKVEADGWGSLARRVRPQMQAWGMDTDQLDDTTRAIGAGLRGENPHNGATLRIRAWNGDSEIEVDGPTLGLEMSVQVPLLDEECAPG